jgi:hypothetical protein
MASRQPWPGAPVPRARKRARARGKYDDYLLTAISFVAQHWRLDDPWEPGIFFDFRKSSGDKRAERFHRVRWGGHTFLDSLIVLADEAIAAAAKT